jgi:hypothetical protein
MNGPTTLVPVLGSRPLANVLLDAAGHPDMLAPQEPRLWTNWREIEPSKRRRTACCVTVSLVLPWE